MYKHSKLPIEYSDVYVKFHRLIEVCATRKTDNKTMEIYAYMPMGEARKIQAVLNFMDEFGVDSLGHANWHVEHNKLSPCNNCHK